MVDSTYMPKVYKTDGGDSMKVASGGHIDIESGGEFRIGGTAITATAAEINAAAGTGVSSTELDLLDGALVGTVVTSKAAVYDTAGKLYRSSASPAAAGTLISDATALTAELNAVTGANGTAGVKLPVAAADEIVVVINTNASNNLLVYPVSGSQINALGASNAFTLTPGQRAEFIGRSATLWYTAAATDTISGLTASAAELNYNDIAALGTGAASKAVVLDAGEDYTWPATGVLTYGVLKDPAATTLVATAAELNRAADVSTRIVTHVATGNVVEATHEGKTNLLGEVGGDAAVALTLPAATGSGAKYKFIVSVLNTSGYVIKVNATPGTDVMAGSANILDNDAAAQGAFAAIGTDDTLTLNGTTTGGQVGDWVEFEDILAGKWAVKAQLVVPAGSNPADMFSATVP